MHVRVDRNYKSVWDEEEENNLVPVFVGNIPWSLSKEDLVAYFNDFHPVTSNLLTNMYGKSRGFAIINFRSEGDAEGAIDTMHGMEINGRVIEVMRIAATYLLMMIVHAPPIQHDDHVLSA